MSIPALKTSFIVSLVFFMGIATALHAQATKPAPPTPIDEKKIELGGAPWNPILNFSIAATLGIALFKVQNWSRWAVIAVGVYWLLLLPREASAAHGIVDIVYAGIRTLFCVWVIWYLSRPKMNAKTVTPLGRIMLRERQLDLNGTRLSKRPFRPKSYLLSIPLAFIRPWIALVLYVVIAMSWFVPDRRIERMISKPEKQDS